jgi:hypothetical protein
VTGLNSTVRGLAEVPFPSRPYRAALLAELEVTGGLEADAVHGLVGAGGIFPVLLAGGACWRLLRVSPDGAGLRPGVGALQAIADRFTDDRLLGSAHEASLGVWRGAGRPDPTT